MDFLNSLASFKGNAYEGDGADEGDEDDFYGFNNTASSNGTATTSGAVDGPKELKTEPDANYIVPMKNGTTDNNADTSLTPTAEERKKENQRKAELLRAKLIAQRHFTPSGAASGSNTPLKSMAAPSEPKAEPEAEKTEALEPSSDIFGLESLLAEGRAAAEAKMREQASAQPKLPTTAQKPPETQKSTTEPGTQNASPTTDQLTAAEPQRPTWAAKLTDAYYADLEIWLEITGYHDVEYRNSKLHTYKERRELEREAARIQERLQKLKEAEQANIVSIRTSKPPSTPAPQRHPPALPAVMPSGDASNVRQTPVATPTPASNGVKRARSPEPVLAEKSTRAKLDQTMGSNGFRIRGANDSPEVRRPSPAGLERRISYPDARRRSAGKANGDSSRDASLERRQNYYKPEAAPPALTPGPPYGRDRYAGSYADREIDRGYDNRSRAGFSSVNRPTADGGRGGYRDYPQPYRGSAGLDLRRGDTRYFMIKSWNHENVVTAMRDGLWATQEKNAALLAEAFQTSRHVVLLFSVNKSVAFQGYAVMASPPDPALPKPPWCAKLNWSTSPTFRIRWLATTSVHFRQVHPKTQSISETETDIYSALFRHVGHLKNTMNLDEQGKPHAVLVGKDGQEISPEAGVGVVAVLDEVEDTEARNQPSAY